MDAICCSVHIIAVIMLPCPIHALYIAALASKNISCALIQTARTIYVYIMTRRVLFIGVLSGFRWRWLVRTSKEYLLVYMCIDLVGY